MKLIFNKYRPTCCYIDNDVPNPHFYPNTNKPQYEILIEYKRTVLEKLKINITQTNYKLLHSKNVFPPDIKSGYTTLICRDDLVIKLADKGMGFTVYG